MKPQLTDTVVMVRPQDFAYNEQTAVDNSFQHRPDDSCNVTEQALNEFSAMVEALRAASINVLVLEPAKQQQSATPDAVFPNNWFSTTVEGKLLIYPMYTENRRQERRVDDLIKLLEQQFNVQSLEWLSEPNESEQILEGTGALVIDHLQQRLYATQSERCHPQLFADFCVANGYSDNQLFQTQSPQGQPIYHTNVMMSIGDQFAVICDECFVDPAQYRQVKQRLAAQRQVIEITYQQMADHFCGNILQLRNSEGERVIVMSQSAYRGFTHTQRIQLAQYGKLLPCAIDTIESIGGGSARCMIAEVFLPRR